MITFDRNSSIIELNNVRILPDQHQKHTCSPPLSSGCHDHFLTSLANFYAPKAEGLGLVLEWPCILSLLGRKWYHQDIQCLEGEPNLRRQSDRLVWGQRPQSQVNLWLCGLLYRILQVWGQEIYMRNQEDCLLFRPYASAWEKDIFPHWYLIFVSFFSLYWPCWRNFQEH